MVTVIVVDMNSSKEHKCPKYMIGSFCLVHRTKHKSATTKRKTNKWKNCNKKDQTEQNRKRVEGMKSWQKIKQIKMFKFFYYVFFLHLFCSLFSFFSSSEIRFYFALLTFFFHIFIYHFFCNAITIKWYH